jgi:hypothetical protein
MFTKATKRAVKARVALDGPTGSGKTWTALTWAKVLGKRTALVDTERGSASLYSDHFDFDVLEMTPPYEPKRLIEALNAAEADGYDVVIVDSLSHFWEGEGGTLDIADAAGERAKGNSFAGWKVATPELRHLVDVMLGLDAHLIVTMRSKMEWVLEEDARGKKVPRKIGLAPVMRQGIDYEFPLVGDLDYEHRLSISKSRSDLLADQMYGPGRAQEGAETFARWLDAGEPVASRNDTDALVARMNRLPDDVRKACKDGFVEHFGRPAGLLASKLGDAQAYIAGFEGDDDPPAPPAGDTNPNQGDGDDGATTEGMPGQAAAAEPGEVPAQTPPAGDAPESEPATTAAPPGPEEPAAAAAPPADGPTFTDRVNALPADIGQEVRTGEKKIRDGGVEPKSAEHIAQATKLLEAAEKKQNKRATDVVLAINAGTNVSWGRAATDDERHQLLVTLTQGAVASAKKVTADQLKAIKSLVRDWQNGSILIEQVAPGEYSIREAVAS